MIMNIPIDVIWSIITDYDNLSVHVPNLVESKVINKQRRGNGTPPRVYQRGAQRIFGFEFGADVTMDMTEHVYPSVGNEEESSSKQYVIDFKCVDSQFFSEFDGSWIVEEYNDDDDDDGDSSPSVDGSSPITMVRYVVDVRPKGPVPVAALEWRIKEDVPVNILAVSKAASAAFARQQAEEQRQRRQKSTENMSRVLPSNRQEQKQSRASLFPLRRQSQRLLSRSQRSTSPRPLQRLTDQATNNIKRTAKAVLPSPMYSTAKQAVNILNNNLSRPRRNDVAAASSTPVQTSSSDSGNGSNKSTPTRSSGGNHSKDMEVDWYDDETMAMYL